MHDQEEKSMIKRRDARLRGEIYDQEDTCMIRRKDARSRGQA
jgi:hypothetical protein